MVKAHIFSPTSGKNYVYWVEGDTQNPWIILLAGFSGTHKDFLTVSQRLKDKYFVIIPDLPGWGKSDPFPVGTTILGYAQYIKDLVNHLGGSNISLVGHCSGSIIALTYMLTYPKDFKTACLVSTPYQSGMISEKIFLHLSNMSETAPLPLKKLFFLWRSRIFIIPFSLFSIKIKSWKKKLRFMLHGALTQQLQNEKVVEDYWNSLIHFDFSDVKKIVKSVHIIHGKLDIVIPLKQAIAFQKLFPSATLDVLPHAGHIPPVETPETLAREIEKYI